MSEVAAFTCLRCGMMSHNPTDAREGYCGNCHDYTGKGTDWATAAGKAAWSAPSPA